VPEYVFDGQYNSGEKASGVRATVIFKAKGLEIKSANGGQLAFWNYEDLLAAAPIAKEASDVLLHHSQTARATLFIRGPGAGQLVINRAPRTAQTFQRFRIVSLSLIVTALAVLAGMALFFGRVSASKAVAALIPAETAAKLGSQSIEIFGPVAPACIGQPGNAALQRILDRLQASGDYGRPFTLHAAQSAIPNAFAFPGRHIVLLSGLVKQAKSPEEVAGVLAHEMGHGLERDPEALFVRNLGMQVLIQFLTGQSGSQSALTAGAFLLQLRYSREAERAADAHAVEILRKARIGPQPTADFFLRDATKSSGEGALLSYLNTHPSSKERAKLFQSQAVYPVESVLSDKEWAEAQAICGPGKKPAENLKKLEKPK
jgi:Zn-dependent protease with chaperone function